MTTVQQGVMKSLGVRSLARWRPDERNAFGQLSPVIALVDGVDRWSATERQGLVRMMRAKGAPQERDFVLLSQQHPRFWHELRRTLR